MGRNGLIHCPEIIKNNNNQTRMETETERNGLIHCPKIIISNNNNNNKTKTKQKFKNGKKWANSLP